MSNSKSHALVLGASGLVGLHTTKLLLQQNIYDIIYAVSRRGIPLSHERLVQIHADYDSIDANIENLSIDHVFSCLGSTKKKTPNIQDYIQIDHDYPLKVAKITRGHGTNKFSIISALGANANAISFYMKMKGETENALQELDFPELYILQPALIIGNRSENRPAERIAASLFKLINPLLFGRLKKYRSIEAQKIAAAMVQTATLNLKGIHRFNTALINKLS